MSPAIQSIQTWLLYVHGIRRFAGFVKKMVRHWLMSVSAEDKVTDKEIPMLIGSTMVAVRFAEQGVDYTTAINPEWTVEGEQFCGAFFLMQIMLAKNLWTAFGSASLSRRIKNMDFTARKVSGFFRKRLSFTYLPFFAEKQWLNDNKKLVLYQADFQDKQVVYFRFLPFLKWAVGIALQEGQE